MCDSVVSSNLGRPRAANTKALMGIGLLIAAVACFAILDTTTKRVTAEVPLLMAIWARYIIQALLTTAYVLPQRGLTILRTPNLPMQLTRGVLLMLVTLLAFLSLKHLPVGEFTAIAMTTPLLVTLLAARLLGEHVSAFRLMLVGGGFIGTMVIVRPGGDAFGWAMLLPVALVIINAAFQLLTSRMTRTEDSLTTQFYTGWVGTLIATVPLLWSWVAISDLHIWLGLILMGVAGAVGHFLLIMAYERTSTATLMPYMYVQIGFAMLGGWIMFDHVPDHLSMLGIGLIALCGIAGGLLTVHESSRRRQLA